MRVSGTNCTPSQSPFQSYESNSSVPQDLLGLGFSPPDSNPSEVQGLENTLQKVVVSKNSTENSRETGSGGQIEQGHAKGPDAIVDTPKI